MKRSSYVKYFLVAMMMGGLLVGYAEADPKIDTSAEVTVINSPSEAIPVVCTMNLNGVPDVNVVGLPSTSVKVESKEYPREIIRISKGLQPPEFGGSSAVALAFQVPEGYVFVMEKVSF